MRRCRPFLGTFVEIDAADADSIEAGFAAIAWVQRLMSAHDPDSEISALNRSSGARPVALSPETMLVLHRAQYWANNSDGCFDIVAAGRAALRRGALPRHPGQPLPDPDSDYRSLRLDNGQAWLAHDACVDVGGIAKGFAVDAAVAAMRAAGAEFGLVNAGGDLFVFGEERTVEIVDPLSRRPRLAISVCNQGVATSGGLPNEEQALDFAHLGGARAGIISITVLAASALDADALTKIAWHQHHRLADLLSLAAGRAVELTHDGFAMHPIETALAA